MLQDRRSRLADDRFSVKASLIDDGGQSAPRLGAELAIARERLGRTLPELSHLLRIRTPYLQALEQGRIDALPGRAYALAFLRTYATALGLDPDEAVRRFKAEAAAFGDKIELDFPAPLPERGLPTGALLLLGLVLAVGAYAGWYRLSGDGRLPAETVQPVPARLARLAAPERPAPEATAGSTTGSTTGTPPGPLVSAGRGGAGSGASLGAAGGAAGTGSVAGPSTGVAAATPASGTKTALSTVATTGSGAGAGAGPTQSVTAPPPDVAPGSAAAATPTPAEDAAMLASGPASRPALAVLATADAWVQVRSDSGAVVFSRLLHAGQSWTVPPGQTLTLTTGNAGGTELVRNGTPSAPLGMPGAVLHNVPLGPATLTGLVTGAPITGAPITGATVTAPVPGAATQTASTGTR